MLRPLLRTALQGGMLSPLLGYRIADIPGAALTAIQQLFADTGADGAYYRNTRSTGIEQNADPNFESGIADWTDASGGAASIAYDAANQQLDLQSSVSSPAIARKSMASADGDLFVLRIDVADGPIQVHAGSASGGTDLLDVEAPAGLSEYLIAATSTTTFVDLINTASIADTKDIDSVSIVLVQESGDLFVESAGFTPTVLTDPLGLLLDDKADGAELVAPYVQLDGVGFLSAPNNGAYDPTTALDIRVGYVLDDFASGVFEIFASNLDTAAPRGGFEFRKTNTDVLQFLVYDSAQALRTFNGGSTTGLAPANDVLLLRANLNVTTGAAETSFKDVLFADVEAELDDDTGWTVLGSGSLATSVNPSQDGLAFGGRPSGAFPVFGRGYGQRLAVDGSVVSRLNPADWNYGDGNTFPSSTTGEVWTINGGARIERAVGNHARQDTTANKPAIGEDAEGRRYVDYGATRTFTVTTLDPATVAAGQTITFATAYDSQGDAGGIFLAQPDVTNRFIGIYNSGDTNTNLAGGATVNSVYIDGVAFPLPATRSEFHAAIVGKHVVVIEATTTVTWTGVLNNGEYSSGTALNLDGHEYARVLHGGSLTTEQRQAVEAELAAAAGITL